MPNRFLFAIFAFVFGAMFIDGLRSGVMWGRIMTFQRTRDPLSFWIAGSVLALMTLISLSVAVFRRCRPKPGHAEVFSLLPEAATLGGADR